MNLGDTEAGGTPGYSESKLLEMNSLVDSEVSTKEPDMTVKLIAK